MRAQSEIGPAPHQSVQNSTEQSKYYVIRRKWLEERQHKILILEVTKVICVSLAFLLFNEFFYGDFPPSEKVIDDKQVNEATIVKYDRLLENLLMILLSLSLLFIICTSLLCHIWTLYMPEPLNRYYRRRKTKEPIQRDQTEAYQASRRQWQYYLIRKSLTSKLGLLPALLPDDKTDEDLKLDRGFEWGAKDITDSLDPSDPSKCSCSSDSTKERFDPDTKSKVDKLMVDNQQKEENEKDWATFYYQWKNLKKFSTAMHWGMLYFDFIVGLFLVLIVLDFNVKSYKKINIVSVVTGLPDWKYNIDEGTRHIETFVICLHAISLLCQMIITLYHIKPSISRIIPDFYFSDSILNKRKAKIPVEKGMIAKTGDKIKSLGRSAQQKMCNKVYCCNVEEDDDEKIPKEQKPGRFKTDGTHNFQRQSTQDSLTSVFESSNEASISNKTIVDQMMSKQKRA